jgi:hypothetical protein
MIKCNGWGNHLRLGNWLFLFTGLNYLAKHSNNKIVLPEYFLWDYLKNLPNVTENQNYDIEYSFLNTKYSDDEKKNFIEFFKLNNDKIINILGYPGLQSEKWFIDDVNYIKNILEIKEEKIKEVKTRYKDFFTKPTIGIGVRRGDFVGHNCFYQIPETWYEDTLKKEFPNYLDYNVIIFSDNIEWCKNYYINKNFLFAESNNTYIQHSNEYLNDPMDQFILGTLCDNFIGGSSTFSWWQMWYVKNFNNGKVIHSGKNLAGNCYDLFHCPHYYPENWIINKID